MIVETYQSKYVLRILKSGEIYRAKPNLTLRGEYAALIDMLGLKCECPIFGVVKVKKKKTFGKVSGSVKLILDVPDKFVRLTEFSEWADFLYAYKFTKPGNYRSLLPGCEEVSDRRLAEIITNLKQQKKVSAYKSPQVVLEKINPVWLKHYQLLPAASVDGGFFGWLKQKFRK